MLELENIRHRYDATMAVALDRLQLADAEHCLLLGRSGSGKTTLLHIAAGLLCPQQGSVRLDETDFAVLRGAALDRFRGRAIGIVFQRLHLIPSLTVLQNLLAAQYCAGLARNPGRALAVLDALGLSDKAQALPAELSQGQAQRVAIARAVVNRPRLILADEPTASLDDANAALVLDLLKDQARACGACLLIATHDARAKAQIERRIELSAEPSPVLDQAQAAVAGEPAAGATA